MTHSGVLPCLPLAGRLTRLAPTAAAASRLLHDRRLRPQWWSAVDGLEFVPLAAPPADAVFRVSLDTAHGVVEACFCAPDLPSMAVAAVRSGDVPVALQALAAEAAMQPVLEALEALGLHDVQVAGLSAVDGRHGEVPASGWVRLMLQRRPVASFVCTRLPEPVGHALRQRLTPARFGSRFAPSLALPGRLTLSARPVRRSVLASLQCGDVLLLTSGGPEQHMACTVSFGALGGRRWCADAEVEDTFLTIQGAGRMTDDDTQDFATDEPPEALSSPPHDIAVPVRFEVATVSLPLSEIESMAHGYVIELDTPLAHAALRLVSCGRVIGTAELVAVGDRLGARINHMAPNDAERTGH